MGPPHECLVSGRTGLEKLAGVKIDRAHENAVIRENFDILCHFSRLLWPLSNLMPNPGVIAISLWSNPLLPPLHRRMLWVLALDPVPPPTGAVWRAKALRYDAFEPELAGVAHSLSVSVAYRGPLLFPSKQ
jgi:hypothetical protein